MLEKLTLLICGFSIKPFIISSRESGMYVPTYIAHQMDFFSVLILDKITILLSNCKIWLGPNFAWTGWGPNWPDFPELTSIEHVYTYDKYDLHQKVGGSLPIVVPLWSACLMMPSYLFYLVLPLSSCKEDVSILLYFTLVSVNCYRFLKNCKILWQSPVMMTHNLVFLAL